MKTTEVSRTLDSALSELAEANAAFSARYPGDSGARQPVHTVYGGAHLFHADMARRLGSLALNALDRFAPDAAQFTTALHLPSALGETVYARVREKLVREPVEDYRIDFEDGYGARSDSEEDGHAVSSARQLAAGYKAGLLPPFIGIRVKPLTAEFTARALRTLTLFFETLLGETGGAAPENFLITLPKPTVPQQPAALARALEAIERSGGLPTGSLRMELMVEAAQAVINARGECNLPLLLEACAGRCAAAHFGAYDYTASCGVTAAHQRLRSPACSFARSAMQAAFAGTGVRLADGATTVLPVPVHRGDLLSPAQQDENRAVVHAAWRGHYADVRDSLENGFYQSMDLHPAQLPTRYAAVYAFYLKDLDATAARLRHFVEKAARATLEGNIFDDAATGQGLLNFFLRATNCGAVSPQEAERVTGLTPEDFRAGSFTRISRSRSA